MLFNSPYFLFTFLPITYIVFWLLKTKNSRYIWLTLTGYWFYSHWNWKFCFLMLFSTVVSYTTGLLFLKYNGKDKKSEKNRKWIMAFPIVLDLCILGFFKYFNFAYKTSEDIYSLFGGSSSFQPLDIVLPVGISFYTFHTISYIVDAYRRQIRPTRNFWEFACYVSLFSQLVAGPIVRFRQIEDDLEHVNRYGPLKNINAAAGFFCIGLAKKVLIADSLAPHVNLGYSMAGSLNSLDAWLTALGYSFQLYFDFSGYSDMAVGLGLLFNLRIPQNFNSPYKSISISDFWRRWHISLSSCIRDYIYIPLGGNRISVSRTYINLLAAMAIGGLWHGANWTFIVWGLYHGGLLAIEKFFKDKNIFDIEKIPFSRFFVFLLAVIGWVIFRAESLDQALLMYKNMFWFSGPGLLVAPWGLLLLVLLCVVMTQTQENTFEIKNHWKGWRGPLLIFSFAAAMLVIIAGDISPFLYFQF